MSVILNIVRRGFYMDSVALMRLAREIAALKGIEEAGLMMGTPANKEILAAANVLAAEGTGAAPGDLVVAVRARDQASAERARALALAGLDARKESAGPVAAARPRTLRSAIKSVPGASLALISVPGPYATAEARAALAGGLNVMMFSDNVPIADEVALKREAQARGLLVLGPDCGTAILNGVPLAFANRVRSGDIGIVGASGTGIQEVSTLIDRLGRGVSHAIGTGGRDLKAEVGAITTLQAIDLLDRDPATHHIVLISKPPAHDVAARVLARIGRSAKPCTICFIGAEKLTLPANARQAATLEEAAELATGISTARLSTSIVPTRQPEQKSALNQQRVRKVHGLYCGGTLCAETQVVLRQAEIDFASNVPIPGVRALAKGETGNTLIDLGDDEFTRGRPHPMIEPAVRDQPLIEALGDPAVDLILIDIVLGLGSHADPAGHVAGVLAGQGGARCNIIASVTGTEADPQRRSAQERTLYRAGIQVAISNAAAALQAVRLLKS